MGLFNELFGWIGRNYYETLFYNHMSTFDNFLNFIHYQDILNNTNFKLDIKNYCYIESEFTEEICEHSISNKDKCYYPCKNNKIYKSFYSYIPLDEIKKFYDDNKKAKFEKKKTMISKIATYRTTITHFEPWWYYRYNCHKLFKKFYEFLLVPYLKIMQLENQKKEIKSQEVKYKEKIIKQKEEATTVKIVDVFKSLNPYQNNAPSIGIKYQIINSPEVFIDYITDSNSSQLSNNSIRSKALFEYKTTRLQIATDTVNMEDIFNKGFDNWKNTIINKELIVDTKLEEGKRKVDPFIGSIFYKIENSD